jgi:hypothetical protein
VQAHHRLIHVLADEEASADISTMCFQTYHPRKTEPKR